MNLAPSAFLQDSPMIQKSLFEKVGFFWNILRPGSYSLERKIAVYFLFFLLCVSSTKSQEKRTPFFSLRMQNTTGSWPKSGCAPVTSTSTKLSPTSCAHTWCLRSLASPCTASCLPCTPFSRCSKLLPHRLGRASGRGGDRWEEGALTSHRAVAGSGQGIRIPGETFRGSNVC